MDDTEKRKIKDYKINESVLVTYHTLNSLYQHFFAMYPTEIGNKIVNLINELRDDLELEQENDYKEYGIEDSFYERVIFVKPSDNVDENG